MSSSGIAAPESALPEAETVEPRSASVAEIAARIAMIRDTIDIDPEGLGRLLEETGSLANREISLSAQVPGTLALLDELETLVGLLQERRQATAEELREHQSRRYATAAYKPRQAGS